MGSIIRRKRKGEHVRSKGSSGSHIGVGSTLAHLHQADLPPKSLQPDDKGGSPSPDPDNHQTRADSPPWETVSGGRPSKKRKIKQTAESDYPAFILSTAATIQSKVKISDLQTLVLYILADGTAPQWLSVRRHAAIRKVVVLMVPGLERTMFDGRLALDIVPPTDTSAAPAESSTDTAVKEGSFHSQQKATTSPDDYCPVKLAALKLPEPLRPLAEIFSHLWPIKTPGVDKYLKMHSPIQAVLNVPLPKAKADQKIKGAKPPREAKGWVDVRTPITEFLASKEELRENDFVLHPSFLATEDEKAEEENRARLLESPNSGPWVSTRIQEDSDHAEKQAIDDGNLTSGFQVLAMDCEMCKTEGGSLELTRVSLVGWDGEKVFDELVKPDKPIIDYLTPYSGITEAMLAPVETRLADVQSKLMELIGPHTLIVGHSLNADLTALKMTHSKIVDTSILYPHPIGPPLKSKLKWLVQKYLGREIQQGHGTSGHDSIEDAKACLDLVRQKCMKGPQWGTGDASSESIFKRLARSSKSHSNLTGSDQTAEATLEPLGYADEPRGQVEGRVGAVVDWGVPEKGIGSLARVSIGCKTDDEVVQGIRRAVNGDEDGKIVRGGGESFVWGRLRQLEAVRGWWNHNRNVNDELLPHVAAERAKETDSAAALGTSTSPLADAVTTTVRQIADVYQSLPPCTALIVYTGSGDPREMSRLQGLQQQFKREYQTKKWDELSVKWTDTEDQQLRAAVNQARDGIGFVVVK